MISETSQSHKSEYFSTNRVNKNEKNHVEKRNLLKIIIYVEKFFWCRAFLRDCTNMQKQHVEYFYVIFFAHLFNMKNKDEINL